MLAATVTWGQRAEQERALPPLSPGATTLSGVVTAGDEPAAGVSVEVQSLSTGELVRAYTSGNGSFSVGNLSSGEYLVTANIGPEQVQAQVSLSFGPADLHLRLPGHSLPDATGATVSAQQLLVPEKARGNFEDAQTAVQHGNLRRAMEKLDEAIAIAPTFALALALRAVVSLHTGDVGRALQDARTAVRSDWNSPQAYFVLAAALNQSSSPKEAAHAAEQGLRLNPRSWEGHFELGRAMVQENRNEQAVKELTSAMQAAPPRFGGVALVRAFALMQLRRYSEAEKDLREAIQRDPKGQAAGTAQQLLQEVEKVRSHRP